MLHMLNDGVSGHSDISENSDEIHVTANMYRAKTISWNFYDTWNYLELTLPSSELSIFVLYPKTITSSLILRLHMERCLEVKILSYQLLHYTENDNSEFSKPIKAFN